VQAGPGVTVDGNGSPATPYVISSSSAATPTSLEVTDTPTVDLSLSGTGVAGDPYEVSAAVVLDPAPPGGGTNLVHAGADGLYAECADVRGCFSAGDGIDYDPATGEIAADLSTDAGNAVVFGSDGGLYAPAASAAALETACGLTGDGSSADPLAAAVGAWGYACDVDTYAGQVYCDTSGQLRSEPRGRATYTQDSVNQSYPATVVPTGFDNVIETRTLSITNPDPCRPAFVVCEVEVDVDFDLAPGAAAAAGITTDEMQYFHNTGSATQQDVHCQVTKVYNRTIAPGGTLIEPLAITMGRGAGGATYNRIQSFMRAFVFNL
jgi:hypothetical protein